MFPGMSELLVILLIVLLIFGAGKLPAIGDALGRSIKNFKRTASGNDEIEVAKKDQLSATQNANLGEGQIEDVEVLSASKQGKHS